MSIKKVRNSHQKLLAMKRPKKVKYIIGIDEVGRGPIAGPVTVCAFAVHVEHMDHLHSIGFRDPKKLSPQQREQFADILNACASSHMCTWAIESSSCEMIDTRGITHAIQNALDRCLKKLDIHPEYADIYLDGRLRAPKNYFRQHTVVHGDDLFPVISCASILAKVFRDQMMNDYDQEFPGYSLFENKGYGTPAHYRAIKKHGPSPLHRRSFLSEVLG